MGLFETMRAVDGTVFRLADHLQRLNASAETLAIANSYSDEQIRQAVDEVLTANKLSDARLRLQVSNGAAAAGQQRRHRGRRNGIDKSAGNRSGVHALSAGVL
ncbi:MAG: aminotransferase class IV [Planctomycetota bacterium]